MFDRLDDLLIRYEELMEELGSPEVASDTNRFRKLMKEQSDLAPIVEAYKEYKKAKQDVEDSLALLDEESDEEMREMAKEELNAAKKRIEELEQELKILLLPKDPNDEKNVIVEIRAGAGGDEAALFASELYRMYVRFAERNRWKTELVSVSENGIGGFKEVVFMITGQGAYSKMKYEDKNRIKNDIDYSTKHCCHHADLRKSLCRNKWIHSHHDQNKNTSKNINPCIIHAIRKCLIASTKHRQ